MNVYKISYSFILCLTFNLLSVAQQVNFSSPNTYRTSSNKSYWKNNKPYEGYWQQDVHYKIQANINDTLNRIEGSFYELTYWNNSPYTIHELYFHLFQNAFIPGSYYSKLTEANKIPIKYGESEKQGLGTVIHNLTVNNDSVTIELFNTILKATLNKPLLSGDSVVVRMKFDTYFDSGTLRRRMKFYTTFNTKHFDGVFWYPTLCVFDKKFQWTTDQDLDKEYYHNFGTFDVALTFPHEYVVEATGNLVNENEVMPDSLYQKLRIENFAKKPFGEAPSIITPREFGKRKTWIYHAENVHNFAFTADPLYRIGRASWNGIKVISLAQEQNASKWQPSAQYTANVIRIYSTDFGMYDWPKIIVADAKDGMEYPMLTLDNGTYPQHQYLLSHEVGHMWFYGMLGSNETYRAFLDEGFTQFLTTWSLNKLAGQKRQRLHDNKCVQKHLDSLDNNYNYLYLPYLNHVTEHNDEPLNTHSCAFNGAVRHGGNYGLVYYKAGTMLYQLKYILGDTLFVSAMKHYVQKWKFKHPYPEDFRDAIIEYTRTDLNWFFDQWLETTKALNYSIDKIESKKSSDASYVNSITFKRKGRMQMPIRFTVYYKDGSKQNYYIPNNIYIPPTKDSVLPMWYGWDLLQPTYTYQYTSTNKIDKVIIDETNTLADYDLTDNQKGKHKSNISFQFDHRVPNMPSWQKSKHFWRPDVWYNGFDGVQLGMHLEGSYYNKYNYSISAWGNTRLGQNYKIETNTDPQLWAIHATYKRHLTLYTPELYWNNDVSYNAGIIKLQTELEKTFRKQDKQNPRFTKVAANFNYLINQDNYQSYLIYPMDWGKENSTSSYTNAFMDVSVLRQYKYTKGIGTYQFTLRTPFIGGDYNYSQLKLESKNTITALKKAVLRSRIYAMASFGNTPLESQLFLAGANGEQMIANKYTRAIGFIPFDWMGYNNTRLSSFQYGGGLNIRGLAGYTAPETRSINSKDSIVDFYRGTRGISWNVEFEFDRFIKIKAKGITKNTRINSYVFSDIGTIGKRMNNQELWSSVYYNAGIGFVFTQRFTPFDITPLVIRMDFPVYINKVPTGENNVDFRYLLSVQKSF